MLVAEEPIGALTAEAVMARAETENFPVASRVLPRHVRGHLLAVYGFARLVDELGDSAPGDRLAALDALEQDLDRAYANPPSTRCWCACNLRCVNARSHARRSRV